MMEGDPDQTRIPVRPMPYYAPPAEGSGAAVASLVLGIIGLICSIIPVIGLISWLIAPAALVTGLLGLKSETNRGTAIGGLVTGGIALIVCILWLLLFGAALASVGSSRPY